MVLEFYRMGLKITLALLACPSPISSRCDCVDGHSSVESLYILNVLGYHVDAKVDMLMHETPPSEPKHRFDAIEFTIATPMATPREVAMGFDQLIDSVCDLTGMAVQRVITPMLSVITVSWATDSVPSEEWLEDVEAQLHAFAACNGLRVQFRRH